MPGWDFDQTVADAQNHWNDMLSRIEIEGGTEQQQRRFYTDLFHAIMGRRIISDADGKYADMTGAEKTIRQLPLNESGKPKFNMYNSDAFGAHNGHSTPCGNWFIPKIAEEFINSFLEYYKNGGLIPRGPSGGNYTFVMNGASSTPFFVSAWQKGIRGFDIDLAYEGLKKNHLPGGMMSKVGYEHNTIERWRTGILHRSWLRALSAFRHHLRSASGRSRHHPRKCVSGLVLGAIGQSVGQRPMITKPS
jgi:putative alpha-1,2-mannosidase